MPTSTTERSRERARWPRECFERAGRGRGFTLLEVLVVVIIIAVLVAVAAVKLAPDARQTLREEAVRLAAVLAQARDEAITTGAALAWQSTATGYRFVQRAPDRSWQPLDSDSTLRARALATGISLAAVELLGRNTGAEPFILLSPTGIQDPFRITLAFGELRVRVSSDGMQPPIVDERR